MPRKSRADRIHEVTLLNPVLRPDDPRITQLFAAEDLLKRAQKEAQRAPLTIKGASGSDKRHPAWVAVDNATNTVRRWRNELHLDRRSVTRAEVAGVRIGRSQKAAEIIARGFDGFTLNVNMLPGYVSVLAAHGITDDDMPREHKALFASELSAQADRVPRVRERLKQFGML